MPEPSHGFVPYLFLDDAAAALDWYARVFGFEEIGRWAGDDGKIHNAEMRAGDAEVWLDGGGRLRTDDPRPQWVGLWVDDVDAIYERIRVAGVTCDAPVDREFGVQMLNVPDGMGYLWGFMRRR